MLGIFLKNLDLKSHRKRTTLTVITKMCRAVGRIWTPQGLQLLIPVFSSICHTYTRWLDEGVTSFGPFTDFTKAFKVATSKADNIFFNLDGFSIAKAKQSGGEFRHAGPAL